MPQTLSASLIVKNEEACLEDCLRSIQGVDEIVIVDTGSTDKTCEIARKYTDKVYTDYKWNDDFAEARNYVNSKCMSDWILTIDADDQIEPDGMGKIRKLIESTKADAINLKAVEDNGMYYYMPLLFRRKPEIYWKGAIHNHLNADSVIDSDIVLLSGHSPAHANDPDRAMRILRKEVEKHPELCREVFYLAREYRYRGDWITALYWYEVYLTRAKWGPEIAEAYLQMARCYWELGRGDEARIACAMALRDSGDFREALEFMARLSGPIGREQWLKYAALAQNRNVLFVRPSGHERDAAYYDQVFAEGYDTTRYEAIYHQVGKWCGGKRVLDIGCGNGPLQKYVKDYHGFDFSKKGIEAAKNPKLWVGNAYDASNYAGDYDVYVALEVLEHLDDIRVIKNIPVGKPFIFSVPSFLDPGHVRCYTETVVRKRFSKLVEIREVIRFNATAGRWSKSGLETSDHILLIRAVREDGLGS